MASDVSRRLSQKIECIVGKDRYDCMQKVSEGIADTVNIEPEDAYIGGKYMNLVPLLFEEIKNAWYISRSAVVIHKDTQISSLADLKGKKSCHSGYRSLSGWNVPISTLISENIMTANCSGDLATIANFFSASCVPGPWSSSSEYNKKLKLQYPQLCSLCQSNCTEEDQKSEESGSEEALKCLENGLGDVAFTTIEEASDFFKKMPPDDQQKFKLLCLDGTINPLFQPCFWASQPTNVFVTSKNKDAKSVEQLRNTLRSIFSRVFTQNLSWLSKVFVSSDSVTKLQLPTSSSASIPEYLGKGFVRSIEMDLPKCEKKSLKLCISSEIEDTKCKALSRIAYSRGLRPAIECFYANSHSACFFAVEDGQADIVTLDAGDVYVASKYHNMVPLMAEQYGELNLSYYAVAVVKRESGITSLADLKDKKSCHTGIGKTAGWNIPVGLMIEQGLIQPEECGYAKAVAEYFSGGSCAPGAKSLKYDPYGDNPDSLCALCMGDMDMKDKCNRSTSERLSGNSGAFRCLATDRGDVAFVQHTTVTSFTDRNSNVDWAKSLRSANYIILCRDGGTRNVDEYENCHLAKVPGSAVMTAAYKTSTEREEIVNLFSVISNHFGPKSMSFKIFGTFDGRSDIIFKDSATALIPIDAEDPDSFLGDYAKLAENLDPHKCKEESGTSSLNGSMLLQSIVLVISIVCLNTIR
ncbi:Transferrin [Nymphon striatum]|nr:Transferrin [Nymphon striatum]